jgi:hypothetical protein
VNIRAHIGNRLRRWADRIDPGLLPYIIEVPPGSVDQIRRATLEELARGRLLVPDELLRRRPPAGGTGEAKAR